MTGAWSTWDGGRGTGGSDSMPVAPRRSCCHCCCHCWCCWCRRCCSCCWYHQCCCVGVDQPPVTSAPGPVPFVHGGCESERPSPPAPLLTYSGRAPCALQPPFGCGVNDAFRRPRSGPGGGGDVCCCKWCW